MEASSLRSVATNEVKLPVLSDGVVILRPFAATDATALVEIWQEPTIRARNTVPEPSAAAASLWIEGHAP